MAGHRHLAILGAAYCGSTTLGLILGSMEDFAFAGETHWLTNVRTPALGLRSILTTADADRAMAHSLPGLRSQVRVLRRRLSPRSRRRPADGLVCEDRRPARGEETS